MENIATPYVFIATQVVMMHSRFMTKPALRCRVRSDGLCSSHFIMSVVRMVLAPNTMAFGAVATGSLKA
jgi:hypothetical protein